MRDKPRMFKRDDGWAVELPAFGFASQPSVKGGFESREAVGEWLKKRDEHSPSGGSFERTYTPNSSDKSAYWGHQSWPVIAR